MTTATAKATPRELARIRTVPCDYCGAPGDGTPCKMVRRDGLVTARAQVNCHDARVRLADFLGLF